MPEFESIEVVEGVQAIEDQPDRGIQKGDWIYKLTDGEFVLRREISLAATLPYFEGLTRIDAASKEARREVEIEAAIQRYRLRTFN